MSRDTEIYERNGYGYNDLTKSQRAFIDGMIAIREEVSEFETEESFRANESIIARMKSEVAAEAIDELDDHIIHLISDTIISMVDENIVEIEDLPRKAAEKKFGKRLVREVLG